MTLALSGSVKATTTICYHSADYKLRLRTATMPIGSSVWSIVKHMLAENAMREAMACGWERIAYCLFTIVIIGATPCRAELPTIEDVFDAHRVNCERLSTLHMQVVITENATQAADIQQQKERDEWQLILDKIDSGEITDDGLGVEAKAAGITVKYLAQQARERLKYKTLTSQDKPIVKHLEVFLKGKEYQVRSPIARRDFDHAAWQFPSAAVDAVSLPDEYANVRIHSRSSELQPPVRVWCGAGSDGEPHSALLMTGHISDSQGGSVPPYMQPLYPRWDYEHPIDAFYSGCPDCYRVIRQEMVDERLLTVVEGQVPHATKVSRRKDDGTIEEVQRIDHLTAWIDLERGAIPVKLERRFGQSWERSEEAAKGRLQETLATKKIVALTNGAYYPTATFQEMYSPGFAKPGETAPDEVHRQRACDCTLVETAIPAVESFFVLSFPAGQKPITISMLKKSLGPLNTLSLSSWATKRLRCKSRAGSTARSGRSTISADASSSSNSGGCGAAHAATESTGSRKFKRITETSL